MMQKTYFNWSTGKDSALALYYLTQQSNLDVCHLLTSVNTHHNRVSMHGLQRKVLIRQIEAIGLPYSTVELPENPTMDEYNSILSATVDRLEHEGYTDCGFGDIFIEDLRAYREKQLTGIQCHFPLWKQDTTQLIHDFVALGFKAVIVCLNGDLLDPSFLGREIDLSILADLPPNVDPCGENGEFHTFCYDGPIFKHPVSYTLGKKVVRSYPKPNDSGEIPFWFVDIE